MCEYASSVNRMYIYYAGSTRDAAEYLRLGSVTKEVVGGVSVYTGVPLHVPERAARTKTDLNTHIQAIRCVHGLRFQIGSSKSLPPEGWEELLDCWTCCQSENNVLLGKKMLLRSQCAFTSDFYFYAESSAVPDCCRKPLGCGDGPCKIFYNTVVWNVHDTALIFEYFWSFFERKSVFLFDHESTRYEVKFFFKTMLCTKEKNRMVARDALKVGMKKTAKTFCDKGHVNRYFMDKIYDVLVRNSIDIDVCGYRVSFIAQNNFST